MSSFTRKIQRQVSPSAKVHPILDKRGNPTGKFESSPPRRAFYMGAAPSLELPTPRTRH